MASATAPHGTHARGTPAAGALYQQMHERYASQSDAAKKLVSEPDAHRAALILVANALLNLDETITRE